MKLVMPIAGRGSRFKEAIARNPQYAQPKPLIDVSGYPMVRWASGSLPFVQHRGQSIKHVFQIQDKDIVFIALAEHEQNFQISKHLKKIYGPRVNVVFLSQVTRGAAETVLMAKKYINSEEPIIVSDSDHFIDGQAILKGILQYTEADGIIPVFRAQDPKWSYSRLNPEGFVDLVAEKNPISEWANIGAYYFRRGRDFVQGAQAMIQENERTNNEFYVAPVYNRLIQNGGKVRLVFPKYVYGLGTPDDLEYFIKHTNFHL